MIIVKSAEIAVPNGSTVALHGTQFKVKQIVMQAVGGDVVLGDSAVVFATGAKISEGGAFTLTVGQHDEIDMNETYVGANAGGVTLKIWAFD